MTNLLWLTLFFAVFRIRVWNFTSKDKYMLVESGLLKALNCPVFTSKSMMACFLENFIKAIYLITSCGLYAI